MNPLRKATTWLGQAIRLTTTGFWAHWLGTGDSYTGKDVSMDSALAVSAFWSCVRFKSGTMGAMPLQLFRRVGDEKVQERKHWLYRLLHDSPNADMSAFVFWQVMIAWLMTWGNAYALKAVNGAGQVIALNVLRADYMTVERDVETGGIRYRYAEPRKPVAFYEADRIFHLKGFSIDGLVGLSVLGFARHTLGLSMAADEAAGKGFASGLSRSGFLKVDKVLSKDKREAFRASVSEFMASDKSGKTMVLEGGMEFVPLSISPQDSELLDSRGFQIEEVCRFCGVMPFMIGHTEKQTSWGTGLEQQVIGWLMFELRPIFTMIEQEIRRSLIPTGEQDVVSAEFNMEGLLRADSAGRSTFYSAMTQNGIYTRNECRAKENLPPAPGGDVLTVQSNLVPLDKLGDLPGAEAAARAAFLAWLQPPQPQEQAK